MRGHPPLPLPLLRAARELQQLLLLPAGAAAGQMLPLLVAVGHDTLHCRNCDHTQGSLHMALCRADRDQNGTGGGGHHVGMCWAQHKGPCSVVVLPRPLRHRAACSHCDHMRS